MIPIQQKQEETCEQQLQDKKKHWMHHACAHKHRFPKNMNLTTCGIKLTSFEKNMK